MSPDFMRAQISAFDMVLAIMVFSMLFVFFVQSWSTTVSTANSAMKKNKMEYSAVSATDLLMQSTGVPIHWENNISGIRSIGLASAPNVLSEKKVANFTALNYSIQKSLLGIPGDFYLYIEDLDGKRLELLKEVAPKVSRVAVIGAGTVSRRSNWKAETEAAAHALGLTLRLLAVDAPEEFGKAFAAITRERPHALFVANSPANASRRGLIIDFAARQKLPAVYSDRDFVELGGLMAYGPDFADLYRRAALYVDKILKGANPGDLPIEQPTKFELVVNLRTARALGLTIPASVLLRADETIE